MSVHHFEAKETKGRPILNTKLLVGLTVSAHIKNHSH